MLRYYMWRLFPAVIALAVLASCGSDPVTPPATSGPKITGVVTDSSGVPIAGAALHVFHILTNAPYGQGGYVINLFYTVASPQTISAKIYAPDGSLDTAFSQVAKVGTYQLNYSPPLKMNGISMAIVSGQSFQDTTYYITESPDRNELVSVTPLATTDAQGKFTIPKSALRIGTLVQDAFSHSPDTISSRVSFIALHSGYRDQLTTVSVNSDSVQQQNVILTKE